MRCKSLNPLNNPAHSITQLYHLYSPVIQEFRKTKRPWDDRLAENRRRWKDLVTPKGECQSEFRKTSDPINLLTIKSIYKEYTQLFIILEPPTPETTTAPETNGVIPETSEEGESLEKDQPVSTVEDVEPAGSSENGGP